MLISSIKQPGKKTQKIQTSMSTLKRKKYKKFIKHYPYPHPSKDANPFRLKTLNDFESPEKYQAYLNDRNYAIHILSFACKKNFSKLNLQKVFSEVIQDVVIDTKNILKKKKLGELYSFEKRETKERKFDSIKAKSCEEGIFKSLFS